MSLSTQQSIFLNNHPAGSHGILSACIWYACLRCMKRCQHEVSTYRRSPPIFPRTVAAYVRPTHLHAISSYALFLPNHLQSASFTVNLVWHRFRMHFLVLGNCWREECIDFKIGCVNASTSLGALHDPKNVQNKEYFLWRPQILVQLLNKEWGLTK